MSQMIAIAMPIVQGKLEQWQKFINKLNGEYKNNFQESRNSLGLHERSFLQKTPHGDLAIVTLEGEDPIGGFQKLFSKKDEYTNWFVEQVKEIHGIDLSAPLPGPVPELIADSKG